MADVSSARGARRGVASTCGRFVSSTLSRSSSGGSFATRLRGRFVKGVEQCKPGGRFARWRRRSVIGCRCVRRWLARRRARSAARPARATRLPTASRCWSAQAQPAPGAARSVRCCRPRSERRDCHRENRTASSRRSQARRAPRQIPAIAPAGWRRLPSNRLASRAICRRCRSAGPKVFSASAAASAAPNSRTPAGLAHRIRLPSAVHSHAGRGLARVGRQSRIARARAPEIPHPSSQLHDRPASKSAAKNQTASRESSLSQAGSGRSTARPGPHVQSGG